MAFILTFSEQLIPKAMLACGTCLIT